MNVSAPSPSSYALAPTRSIHVDGNDVAYRQLGPTGGVPVVLLTHLAATLDNWDPRVVDAIAQRRHVIAFDQPGVGASTGRTPRTIEAAAADAADVIRALGFDTVDVVGFSMGGMIAQDLVLAHPALVRRLVLAGTGPRGGRGIARVVAVTYLDLVRAALTRSDVKEFLFFRRNPEGRRAARAFLQRLEERTADRDAPISLRSFQTQLWAIRRFGRSAPADLSTLTLPTLVANGDHDRMVPSVLSEDLHRLVRGSELVIYPDAGHGGIFQHHEDFAPRVAAFLAP